MVEEIFVIDLPENATNMEGHDNDKMCASDSDSRESSVSTINASLDDSKHEKIESSKLDRQNNSPNINDHDNSSIEDELKV